MNIVVVYAYYQGCEAPGHSLMYELTQYLAAHGHEVTVVSGETGYMQRGSPQLPWYRRIIRRELHGKVRVVRTLTYTALHRNYLGRALSYVSFALSCPLGLLSMSRPDLVLASSPPPFPMLSALLVCKLRRIPFVLEVRDLWPDSAVQLGLLRNQALIAVTAAIERVLYTQAERIVALTQGIRASILERGWPAAKVEVVTCGVDFNRLNPDPGAGAGLRAAQGWGAKKVVMYFGTLGAAANLSVILRAAARMRQHGDVLFVLVGDGMHRDSTIAELATQDLGNVLILPPVPKTMASAWLNAADLCLATLQDLPVFAGAIPTKLLDYMACARPVLCGIRGEAKRIVEDAGAGMNFDPDDDGQLAELILGLLADASRRAALGNAGWAYVQQHFPAERKRQRMEEILAGVAAGGVSQV